MSPSEYIDQYVTKHFPYCTQDHGKLREVFYMGLIYALSNPPQPKSCVELANKIGDLEKETKALMATQKEIADQLLASVEQMKKAQAEQRAQFDTLNQKIADLTAAVEAQGNASQDLVDAAASVKEEAQALDDMIPDDPTPGGPTV